MEDATQAIRLSATDLDGDALTYSIVDTPSHGAVTGTPPNVVCTPATNYMGADSFTFRAHDGKVFSGVANVSLSVLDAFEVWRRTVFTAEQLTNAAISIAAADPDYDGLNNEQEYRAGTNPTNESSCLVLYAPTNNIAVDQSVVVRWQSVSGKTYTVQAATNLSVPFTNLRTDVGATPDVNVHTDNVANTAQRFYRVKVP